MEMKTFVNHFFLLYIEKLACFLTFFIFMIIIMLKKSKEKEK